MPGFADLLRQLGNTSEGEVVPSLVPIVRGADQHTPGFSLNPWTDTGKAHPGLPEILRSTLRGIAGADDAGRSGVPVGQALSPDVTNLVMALGTGGGAALAPEAAGNEIVHGTFIGRNAATADKSAFRRADEMLDRGPDPLKGRMYSGASNEELLKDTGTFLPADGLLRKEIFDPKGQLKLPFWRYPDDYRPQTYTLANPSKPLRWSGDAHPGTQEIGWNKEYNVGQLLNHPELFAAYPDLAQIKVRSTGLNMGLNGAYDHDKNTIYLANRDPEGMYSTMLHELQHAIQAREGFEGGGSPSTFMPQEARDFKRITGNTYEDYIKAIRDAGQNSISMSNAARIHGDPTQSAFSKKYYENEFKFLDSWPHTEGYKTLLKYRDVGDKADSMAFNQYRALAGESEARQVQRRIGQDPATNTPPWLYPDDVPLEQQIIQHNGKLEDPYGEPVPNVSDEILKMIHALGVIEPQGVHKR